MAETAILLSDLLDLEAITANADHLRALLSARGLTARELEALELAPVDEDFADVLRAEQYMLRYGLQYNKGHRESPV